MLVQRGLLSVKEALMGLFSDKLRMAKSLIDEFNQQMQDSTEEGLIGGIPIISVKHIDPEHFVDKLVLYGAAAEEMLKFCTWEDLENCGLPRLLAKKVAKVFRASKI